MTNAETRAREDILAVIQNHGTALVNDPEWKDARTFQLPNDEFDGLVERVRPWIARRDNIPFFSYDGYTVKRSDPWDTPLDAVWVQKSN